MVRSRLPFFAALFFAACTPKLKDELPKYGPRFAPIRATLAKAAATLPRPPAREVLGGALEPLAILDEGGNTQLFSLFRFDHEVPANIDNSELETMMDWADEPSRIPPEIAAQPMTAEMRVHLDSLLQTRYVLLYRTPNYVEHHHSEVEGFLVDLTSGAVVRVVHEYGEEKEGPPYDSLPAILHDRLYGALAGRAGVRVLAKSMLHDHQNEVVRPLTELPEEAATALDAAIVHARADVAAGREPTEACQRALLLNNLHMELNRGEDVHRACGTDVALMHAEAAAQKLAGAKKGKAPAADCEAARKSLDDATPGAHRDAVAHALDVACGPRKTPPDEKCRVEMPEADVEDVDGLSCAEAETLARTMRSKGFEAKVVKLEH